jgi:DNA-directed RNA polymerase specialized sigma24 family protein
MREDRGSWDEPLARKIARRVAQRKLPMFFHFKDLSLDDLTQEGVAGIVRKHADWDSTLSALTSWYYLLASRRLLDLHRARTRIADNEGKAATLAPTEGWDDLDAIDQTLEGEADAPALAVEDWLRSIYQHARRSLTAGRYRQGRRFYNVAQVVAVGLFHERMGSTLRGSRQAFLDNREFAAAVHFRHVPGVTWFHGASEVRTRIFSTFSGPQKAALRRLLEHPLRTERITV